MAINSFNFFLESTAQHARFLNIIREIDSCIYFTHSFNKSICDYLFYCIIRIVTYCYVRTVSGIIPDVISFICGVELISHLCYNIN